MQCILKIDVIWIQIFNFILHRTMSDSRIWQNRPTIYLLINVIQIKSFHESTLLSLKKVFYVHKDKNPNASETEQDSPNMMLGKLTSEEYFLQKFRKTISNLNNIFPMNFQCSYQIPLVVSRGSVLI